MRFVVPGIGLLNECFYANVVEVMGRKRTCIPDEERNERGPTFPFAKDGWPTWDR